MSDLIFDEPVLASANHGRRRHAAIRRASSLPGTFTISTLCHTTGHVRGTNTLFDPSEVTDPCMDCVRTWNAKYAPQIDGWTKACVSCERDKPINQFHVDKRTRDGLSKTCFDCARAARAAVTAAEELIARASHVQRRKADAEERHVATASVINTYQESSLVSPFECTRGHLLEPVRIEEAGLGDIVLAETALSCRCGTVSLTKAGVDMRAVFRTVEAMALIEGTPVPAPVAVA